MKLCDHADGSIANEDDIDGEDDVQKNSSDDKDLSNFGESGPQASGNPATACSPNAGLNAATEKISGQDSAVKGDPEAAEDSSERNGRSWRTSGKDDVPISGSRSDDRLRASEYEAANGAAWQVGNGRIPHAERNDQSSEKEKLFKKISFKGISHRILNGITKRQNSV